MSKNRNQQIKAQRRAEKRAARTRFKEQSHCTPAQSFKLNSMPDIIGADFQDIGNDIVEIKRKINALPKSDYKRRILFSSEASYLNTGFATFTSEVMQRLHKTGKFDIAEIASYGNARSLEPRAKSIPWQYYHVLPINNIEAQEYQSNYRQNQFGKWKLSYALADFKPDVLFDLRDAWMVEHINQSPLRDNFLFFLSACVDSHPQKWEWLRDYSKVDHLFAYSWFGKKVLEEQSRCLLARKMNLKPLNVTDVIQAGVDNSIFKPIDKIEAKKAFGIPPGIKLVGTVMRNQPRKLFPRILQSFQILKENYPLESKDTMLLLHTSVPDVGWDLPEAIARCGLIDHVVFSYLCNSCGMVAISTFVGSPTNCPSCGNNTFHTPNTQFGYPPEHFNFIYNLMDIYIQGSIAEGDAIPISEAKSAGCPCLISDYSAMYEKARNGGALPIKNLTENPKAMTYVESETMQNRSLFDRYDLAEKMAMLLRDENKRANMSIEARKCAEKYYNWDLAATKLEYHLLSVPIKDRKTTWERTIEIKTINENSPPSTAFDKEGNREWLVWCYKNILGRSGIDPEGLKHWTGAIENATDKNKARSEIEKHFRQMVNSENFSKMLIKNPDLALTDPVEKIRKQIHND